MITYAANCSLVDMRMVRSVKTCLHASTILLCFWHVAVSLHTQVQVHCCCKREILLCRPSPTKEEELSAAPLHASDEGTAKAHGVADMIKRFDSGTAWGDFRQGHKAKGQSLDSLEHSERSPRIFALRREQQEEEEHKVDQAPAVSASEDDSKKDEILISVAHQDLMSFDDDDGICVEQQQDQLIPQAPMQEGTSVQPRLIEQSSFATPKLRGQGSSMRGDLWLPQQWLKPAEQLPHLTTPRDRMHAAMKAVRAAERAVEAANALSPSRCFLPFLATHCAYFLLLHL